MASKFSEKSKNTIFKAISWKKKSGYFPGPWIREIFSGSFWNTCVGHVYLIFAIFFAHSVPFEAYLHLQ